MGLQVSYGDGNCFISKFTSPARSGENIRLTRPLSYELFKKVLSVFFSHTIPYIEKILSTSECSCSYRLAMEMGIVS